MDNPTRTHIQSMSFESARDRLHQHIEQLTGEDLAAVLAEIYDAERGRFIPEANKVILEKTVKVPYCRLVDCIGRGEVAIQWFNENNEPLTTTLCTNDEYVHILHNHYEVTVEQFVKDIAKHLGFKIS